MNEESADVQQLADDSRVREKSDLTAVQAVTMSIVAVLAVVVGTVYGTILF